MMPEVPPEASPRPDMSHITLRIVMRDGQFWIILHDDTLFLAGDVVYPLPEDEKE